MTEEERLQAVAEGLGGEWVEPDDWEPISTLAAPWCGHNILRLVRDDFALMGQPCDLALCVVCGSGMVHWKTQNEDR